MGEVKFDIISNRKLRNKNGISTLTKKIIIPQNIEYLILKK